MYVNCIYFQAAHQKLNYWTDKVRHAQRFIFGIAKNYQLHIFFAVLGVKEVHFLLEMFSGRVMPAPILRLVGIIASSLRWSRPGNDAYPRQQLGSAAEY